MLLGISFPDPVLHLAAIVFGEGVNQANQITSCPHPRPAKQCHDLYRQHTHLNKLMDLADFDRDISTNLG